MPVKLTLFRKGVILVALPLLFELLLIAAAGEALRQSEEASRWVLHSKEVLQLTEAVLTGLVETGAAARGFVVTGDPGFLADYDRATGALPAAFDQLKVEVSDDPAQRARAEAIAAGGAAWLRWHAETVRLARAGSAQEALARVRGPRGREQMAALRRDIAAFRAEEERLDAEREARYAQARKDAPGVLLLGAALSFLITVLLALVFSRGISRRLGTLLENTRRLGEGKELAPPVGGGDEIARADAAFRTMAADLARARDALADRTRVLESILESMGDGVFVADERGRILLFNPAAERILGRGRTEGPPAEWPERYGLWLPDKKTPYPPDQLPMARALRGEAVDGVEVYVRPPGAGEGVWVSVTARPLMDPGGTHRGGVTVFRDVTLRKRDEEALRKAADEIRDLYDNAPCGYHSLDPDGAYLAVNETELRWLGYCREEVVGKKRFPDLLSPPDRDLFRAHFPHFKESGRVSNLEFDMVRKDGSVLPVLLNADAVRDEAGRYVASRSTVIDITERRRADEEVRRLNADLERRVAERTAELAEANRDLAQQIQENELFVYSVSHDLRSPLVNLQGFSGELGVTCRDLRELLDRDEVPAGVRGRGMALLDDDMAASLNFILTAVARLGRIIDALLRLSRAGRVDYHWEEVDVKALVARVVGSMNVTVQQRGATVTVGDLPPAWGDRTALEQAFANLIGNALNYLDPARPGRVEVGGTHAAPPGPAEEGAWVTYFVRDNGQGIPAAYQARVFQAFQRFHADAAPGEGMGLAIVRRVAERHRGRVWVESKEGEGSTFYLALPRPGPGGART